MTLEEREPTAITTIVPNIEVCLYAPLSEGMVWRTTTFRDGKPYRVAFDTNEAAARRRYISECALFGKDAE